MKRIIQSLVLASVFFLVGPSTVLADSNQVIQMTGEYFYLNHYKIAQKKIKEMVNTLNEQGKQHMVDLKSEGYTCMHKMNSIYECSIFAAPEEKNEKIEDILDLEFSKRSLNFAKMELGIDQTNDSEYLQEFTISGNLTFGDFSVNQYNYQILKDSLHKISFVNPTTNDKYYFNIVDTNVLQVPKLITFQKDNISTTYFVLVDYEHQCCPIND